MRCKKFMNYLKANPDFLIIGGGIFGCSIAWNLSRRSSGSVLLLERLANEVKIQNSFN